MNKHHSVCIIKSVFRRLRCFVGLLFSTLLLVLWFMPCQAAEEAAVRVAVIDYPNYIQMDEEGKVSGYAFEYLQELQKYTGWQYEFIPMSFADATEALTAGDIDLVAGNQYTQEREKLFYYSKRDMGEGGSVLCVRLDDMRYCYNDYASYGGLKIAALAGSVRIEQARAKLAQYGVSADFIEYDTDKESKDALMAGDVDAVLMSTIRCESDYKILARLNTTPLYFCISQQRPELKQELDQAVEQLHLDRPYYEEELDEKYYGAIPIQLAFTEKEKEYIAASGPINVAVSSDPVPLEYYSASDDSYHGVVIDTFNLIGQYSGLTFNFVPREEYRRLKEQLASGQVSLVASVAEDTGIADWMGVDLTSPYRDNSVSLVINSSIEDYKNTDLRMVLRTGYPYFEQFAETEGYTNLSFTDTFDHCIELVEEKKADLTLIPSNCADSLIYKHFYDDLSSYLMPDSNMSYCVGVSKTADPLFLSILNKSIASITREQRTELLVQNLASINQSTSLQNFIYVHRLLLIFGVVTIALFIVAAACCMTVVLKRSNLRLEAALAKADSASRAKTEFLARMSHDMRTPMNGILGLSYLMEDQTDAEAIKKELPELRESGEYLLQLINDVLDVNKVESGKIQLHPTVCDEEQVFASIISMLQPQIEKKNIEFHFTKDPVEWHYVLLDIQRVKQIFLNLLGNAVKFTPDGGRIDFIMERISEDKHRIGSRFIIRDTGIGMTEEFLPRLFEPFAQENRASEGIGGTGLGMAIVKSLVELMGGTIDVKSRVHEGTTIALCLYVPLAKQPDFPEMSEIADDAGLPAGLRILLCEDHPLNAQIAIRLLEKKGAEVTWAENGRMCTDIFAHSEPDYYDVILMDIRMPVMNGIEATRAIRVLERPDAGRVPIIAMTANAYDEDVQKSLEAGMNAHLAKPIEPEKMYAAIARAVGQAGNRGDRQRRDRKLMR